MSLSTYEKPNFFNAIFKKVGKITAGTNGTFGADTNGTAIHTFTKDGYVASLKIFTDDNANNGAFLYVLDGSTVIPLATIAVPLNSGVNTSVVNVDALSNSGNTSRGDWIEQNGKRVIPCKAGQILKFSPTVTLGGGESMWVTATMFEKD